MTIALACLLLVQQHLSEPSSTQTGTCTNPDASTCLTKSKILHNIRNTTNTTSCCKACFQETKCVAWNINIRHRICYLRSNYIPNKDPNCVSGRIRGNEPSPSPSPPQPSPSPSPSPPPPPSPAPHTVQSDQQPRFHFMPHNNPGFSNDIQGPFYDPRHELYHMGFAWHANSSSFGGAPNRWYHIVSQDLARWRVVTTSLDTAMIKPGNWTDRNGNLYCDHKPTTGSVTLVDHGDGRGPIPTALFGCNGSGEKGTVIAKAVPRNLSDPLLTHWVMDAQNPVMRYPEGKGGRDPATAWRDVDGKWRTTSACEGQCADEPNKLAAAALWTSADFETWTFSGNLFGFPGKLVECPDFFNITSLEAPQPLHVLKASYTHREIAYVGRYDQTTHKLVELVGPDEVEGGQLLDGGAVYASKSFWDAKHAQQVWSAWVHNRWLVPGPNGRRVVGNISLAGTHTLPRALRWDADLGRILTPPVPQLQALRGLRLCDIRQRTVPAGEPVTLKGVQGMQLEVLSTWSVPQNSSSWPVSFGIALRLNRAATQRTDCALSWLGPRNASLETFVNNTGAVVDTTKHGEKHTLPFPLKPNETSVTLHCFIDHSVLEAFGMEGRAAVTARTYPLDASTSVAVWSAGFDATLLSLQAWEIDTIWVEEV